MPDPKDYKTLDFFPSGRRATDDEAVPNLERERIIKALAVLPEAQREVITLAYFEGYSQSEISSKLSPWAR
jgi:DNA-directed RNA polymerase specialized sigma24 family protein